MDLRASRVVPPLAVAVLTAAMALIPALRDHRFYLTDDSAAQFLPSWYHLGELLRSGQFPLLDPTLWAGGNIAAEALFGIWNPVLLATMVFVSLVPNLVVASVVVKAFFLVLLALGVYGLAREYDVTPGFAAVAAVTVPFAGVTLYFDAASWASGLTAFAFVPWFWWTLRRSARGELTPLVPFVAGYLAMTAGNPYGALGSCLAVVGLVVEFAWSRRWAPVRRTLLGGIAVGLVAPLTYLPLVLTQSVTYRNDSKIGNSGLMVPGLGDLLNASTPSFAAWVDAFEHPYLTVPATYLAWYALPLLPWLRYRAIVDALVSRMAVPVYAVLGLAFSVGPSEAWMFRWPLRVVPLLRAADGDPAGDRAHAGPGGRRPAAARGRVPAADPGWGLPGRGDPSGSREGPRRLGAARRHPDGGHRGRLAAVAHARCRARSAGRGVRGGAGVPGRGVPAQHEPQRLPVPHERRRPPSAALVPRYPGTMLQVANNGAVVHSADPAALTSEVMFGNMLQAVGVQAVTSYYGMGFKAFTDSLCIEFNGSVCPDALRRAFEPPAPGAPPLADLLRLETVVVQNDLPGVADVAVPDGWRVAERSAAVTVLRREAALPHPQGRLSDAPVGTVVADDVAAPRGEAVRITDGPGGTLTFARLAWPGYVARLDGAGPCRSARALPGCSPSTSRRARTRSTLAWSPPAVRPVGARRPARRRARRGARHRPGGPQASLRSPEAVSPTEPAPVVAEPVASR